MKSPTDPPETSLPRPWASPEAQLLFGQALVKTGQKFKDKRSILLGWEDQRVARASLAAREKANEPPK